MQVSAYAMQKPTRRKEEKIMYSAQHEYKHHCIALRYEHPLTISSSGLLNHLSTGTTADAEAALGDGTVGAGSARSQSLGNGLAVVAERELSRADADNGAFGCASLRRGTGTSGSATGLDGSGRGRN
jgi:hypothetical protein